MLTSAPASEPNMSPMISSETPLLIRRETINMTDNTAKDPMAEAVTNNQLRPSPDSSRNTPNHTPKKITTATPNPAPELIPKMNGPASGFRNNVCICNPLMPKALPAKMAVIAFGNRKFPMILSQTRLSVFPIR